MSGGHIGFSAGPVSVWHPVTASFLNQWMDIDQTCIGIFLGGGKELIRFW